MRDKINLEKMLGAIADAAWAHRRSQVDAEIRAVREFFEEYPLRRSERWQLEMGLVERLRRIAVADDGPPKDVERDYATIEEAAKALERYIVPPKVAGLGEISGSAVTPTSRNTPDQECICPNLLHSAECYERQRAVSSPANTQDTQTGQPR